MDGFVIIHLSIALFYIPFVIRLFVCPLYRLAYS